MMEQPSNIHQPVPYQQSSFPLNHHSQLTKSGIDGGFEGGEGSHDMKSPSVSEINFKNQLRSSAGGDMMQTPPPIADGSQGIMEQEEDSDPVRSDLSAFSKFEKISEKIDRKQNLDLPKVLKYIGEMEQEIEAHKQRLVNEGHDYNTIDAFRVIDVNG
eukprot:CAMPEP_0170506648 /NCGR_PEP_ID=MMETSP0208-20121228/55726_1 /TAXON_ID=197538 /ORGANISM="Strombidium inclinatum, Strain S3" /LENGTH=157 /DNA_ID=CAMNT_0010788319 /DNA_START=1418 /DNA_END=1891 /DNA_ORIENTATION=-